MAIDQPRADYRAISSCYDEARDLRMIEADAVLAEYALKYPRSRYRGLEIGRGSGNYLRAQKEYSGVPTKWVGIDQSPEMLSLARK